MGGLATTIVTTLAVEAGRALISAGAQKIGTNTALLAAPKAARIDPLEKAKWLRAKGLSESKLGS